MKARREFSEAFKAGVEYAKAETGDYEKHIVWPDADEIEAAASKAFYAHRGIRELTRDEMLEHLRGLGCVNPRITEDTPNRVVITYDHGPDESRIYGFCIRTKIGGVDIAQVKLQPVIPVVTKPASPTNPLEFALGFASSTGERCLSLYNIGTDVLRVAASDQFIDELQAAMPNVRVEPTKIRGSV